MRSKLNMCGSAKLNIYGDRLLPTTGVHGGNISMPSHRRSISSFLISAIALAGLRFFGQVRVQFMIVWHR